MMDVPSKEGLTVQLEVCVLFHLDPEKAPEVYRTVGPNYEEIILVPQFRSVARGVTASYDARALYTSEREQLARDHREGAAEVWSASAGIVVEATPLRRVGLPAGLTEAIEEKLRAEQESQRMEFVLTKEKQEAERKRIEARGHRRLPADRRQGDLRAAAALEGDRGDREARRVAERQGGRHRRRQGRPAADPRHQVAADQGSRQIGDSYR